MPNLLYPIVEAANERLKGEGLHLGSLPGMKEGQVFLWRRDKNVALAQIVGGYLFVHPNKLVAGTPDSFSVELAKPSAFDRLLAQLREYA